MAAQLGTNRGRVQRVRDVLDDTHRRNLLEDLASLAGDHVSLETLVDREVNRTPKDRERVASDLHHIDLPMLADLGVITYDTERRHVTHHSCRVVDVLALASEALEGPHE